MGTPFKISDLASKPFQLKAELYTLFLEYLDEKIMSDKFGHTAHESNIPLLALDSDTFEEPGSAELQYKVFVYG